MYMTLRHMGEWRYSFTQSLTLALVGQVVSFAHWPLYTQGKNPSFPLNRRLGGPHNKSGQFEEIIHPLPLPVDKP
jgi:hypothetical protein